MRNYLMNRSRRRGRGEFLSEDDGVNRRRRMVVGDKKKSLETEEHSQGAKPFTLK